MHYRSLFLFLLFILFNSVAPAQNAELSSVSKKAVQYYQKALDEYKNYNYTGSIKLLNKSIEKDTLFYEAYLLKAQIHNNLGQLDQEILSYEKAFSIDSNCYDNGYYFLAKAQLQNGKYKAAKKNLELFSSLPGVSHKLLSTVNKNLKNCDFAIDALQNPVVFNPVNLGDSINTTLDEYWPSLTADESIIVFTRLLPRNPAAKTLTVSFKTHHEDLFISQKIDDHWNRAQNMGININTSGNEGTQTLSVDGMFYVFTACNRKESVGGCDLFYVEKEEFTWSEPMNFSRNINTRYLESQPSLSADGQTLYFVSNRPGGYGKFDIWKSELSEDGFWQQPENLGDSINTGEDDQSPFIHHDNQTIYFASNGHQGMGGSDIFMAKRKGSSWSKPLNIGYPINTHKDEMGLFIAPNGRNAYFSSDRNTENGRDIFTFELPEALQPNFVVYVKGIISDAITGKKLLAKIEIMDLDSIETLSVTLSSKLDGSYLFCLPAGKDYAMNVSKRGYLFHSENFSLSSYSRDIEPYFIDVALQPIQIGSKAILKNIFFEFDAYALKKESYAELDKLVEFLENNPDIVIEIGGHTDNTGSIDYNLELSEKRAKSVYDYLLSENIPTKSIVYKGYGQSNPIADNTTPEGRALNRRTEFMIVDK